jgi:Transposase DDE domain
MMPAAFAPFVRKAPLCVMARLALESLFLPRRLDALFLERARRQYHKELLFSQVVELMLSVVLRVDASVHAAYRTRAADLPVSDQAIYDKLRRMELGLSAALVQDSAAQVRPVIDALGARLPAWLPGLRVRVLDGNLLSKTQRRLKELRQTWAAGLPGRVLAVYEQELDLVTDVFLTPDGHASERTLLDDAPAAVRAKDLWIADANFCTLKFLFGLADAGARFVLRQHGSLVGRRLGQRRWRGRTQTGEVYEQDLELRWRGRTLRVRRVTPALKDPTRDGDTEVHVLSNLPEREAAAAAITDLYRKRWTIEGRFYEVAQTLTGEPNTLGYPKAALFAFCLALVASNAVALLRASLRAAHGAEAVGEMSRHYMATEVRDTYGGMMVALPPRRWSGFGKLGVGQLAEVLREVAGHACPGYYRKARRGPKKPATAKDQYKNGGHVSTHTLLQSRRKLTE